MPGEEEITKGTRHLRFNRSGRPLGIRVDHIKQWLAKGEYEERPDDRWRSMIISLVQTAFRTGEPPAEPFWLMMVLPPKGGSPLEDGGAHY